MYVFMLVFVRNEKIPTSIALREINVELY